MTAAAVEIDAMVDEKDPGERLARIETIVDQVKKDVDGIRSTLRWIGLTLGGALLIAFANFVVNGGLAPPPGP